MVCKDVLYVVSEYLDRNDFINILFICKDYNLLIDRFMTKYLIKWKNSKYDREFLSEEVAKYIDNINDEISEVLYNIKNIMLEFDYRINKPIDNLSKSITHLKLGWFFNQRIDNLPDSITHLTLFSDYDQDIDNLPDSITHLEWTDICYK